MLSSSVADFIIFIEHSKSPSSKSLDELFRSLNLDAVSARMQPGQLWLDAETIDTITSSLTTSRRRKLYGRSRLLNSASFVPRAPHAAPNCRGLRSLRFSLPPSVKRWDLEKLESLAKRILFPSAVLSNTCPDEHWIIPQNKNDVFGMSRCIELAKVKVFSTRQSEIGRSIFSEYLKSVEESPAAASLRSGVLSVHANLSMQSGTDSSVLYEATAGAIIIRKWTGVMTSLSLVSQNVVCIQGVFSDKDIQLLDDLVSHCVPYSLPEKSVKTTAYLTSEEKKQVQMNNAELPVPEGWWFDGSSFVDVHGRRSAVRPDTEHLNELFVDKLNEDVIKYNELLREVKMYL